MSFLPQFVNTATASLGQHLYAADGYYLWHVAYFAGGIGRWLRTRTVIASCLRWITGSSFISLGVWAALPDRR